MLSRLLIQNYAIIDELEIDFHPKFTVITGETGAGKSIILGALSLILGERADTSVLIDKDKKCIVEAVFDIRQVPAAQKWLQDEDLDLDLDTHIRREISTSGKSRAFINDTPVQLTQLQTFGLMLVDLNRQFDNRLLHQASFTFEMLDSFTSNAAILEQFRKLKNDFVQTSNRLKKLVAQEQTAKAEAEYLEFVYNELEQAAFQPNEIEELESKVKAAQHQEDIVRALASASYIIQDAEESQISQLHKVTQDLASIAAFAPHTESLQSRLQSVLEELKDIGFELNNLSEQQSFDPEHLQQWIDRLDLGFKILRKHSLPDTAALLEFQEELQGKLSGLQSIESDIGQLQESVSQLALQLDSLAEKLTQDRTMVIPEVVKQLETTLHKIGMPNARLRFEMSTAESYNDYGKDEVLFLIDANKSDKFLSVSKVASGGELSRLLLAIKSIVSQHLSMPTMIFDEVDAAISGEAARQVALLMQQISTRQQVIVLSHQAQMAAIGAQHLFIYKEEDQQSRQLKTKMRELPTQERVQHIAQMIGGANPGKAAIQSAEELLAAHSQKN